MSKDTILKIVKPSTEAEKATHTVLDTIEVTPNKVRAWKLPPFQRPLRVNDRVSKLVTDIRKTLVVPGTVVLGVLDGDTYLVDGQHRREAFLLAEVPVGYADVRIIHAKSMAELANEFKALNSRLVNMRPDDFLKAMEPSSTVLQKIRKRCPFVGYDSIRRSEKAPIMSMSAVIRAWDASAKESPARSTGGGAVDLVEGVSIEEADNLIAFLELAFGAWGRDMAYGRLWSALNLQLCMWLYRRVVLGYGLTAGTRSVRLDPQTFGKCLMALSADGDYLDWLVGRQASERDRAPAYNRIKKIFADRIELDTGKKPLIVQPPWATHLSSRK